MKTTEKPISVEQTFNSSITDVWNAITEIDQMKKWFFKGIEAFKPEVGFQTQFIVRVDRREFTHLWKITEVVPKQKITYNWKYKEYPGDSFVTFELTEGENKVRLRLSTSVVEDFPDNIPEFKRESGVQGWIYFIKGSLKVYLETNHGQSF